MDAKRKRPELMTWSVISLMINSGQCPEHHADYLHRIAKDEYDSITAQAMAGSSSPSPSLSETNAGTSRSPHVDH